MQLDWTDDELILACKLLWENDLRLPSLGDARLVALSDLLRSAPIYAAEDKDDRFRSPKSVRAKLSNIQSKHPDYVGVGSKGNRLDGVVLQRFLDQPELMAKVAEELTRKLADPGTLLVAPLDPDEEISAPEGRVLMTQHLRRERSTKFRAAKLALVRAQDDPIACEACGFDFGLVYGNLGDGFIEVHHVLPLHASGPTTTRLDDLALLCSNCHRMIHRARPWLTPDALRAVLDNVAEATANEPEPS